MAEADCARSVVAFGGRFAVEEEDALDGLEGSGVGLDGREETLEL